MVVWQISLCSTANVVGVLMGLYILILILQIMEVWVVPSLKDITGNASNAMASPEEKRSEGASYVSGAVVSVEEDKSHLSVYGHLPHKAKL